MNPQGDFDPLAEAFPTRLLPRVFAVVLDEWPRARRPTGNPLENRITNLFVGHLQNVMRPVIRKQKLPGFKFHCRPKLPDADSDTEAGEVDIYLDSYSRYPDAYFVFECKRLNVTTDSGFDSQASKYVGQEGMGCFLSGQYPATCGCGGMLGYVMDGDVVAAVRSVNRALKSHCLELCLHPPHELSQAAIMPLESRVRQTAHAANDCERFLIYHILLAY